LVLFGFEEKFLVLHQSWPEGNVLVFVWSYKNWILEPLELLT
jgi:hypothetical protein